MSKRLSFAAKEAMVGLAGACFWYWNGFFGFLESCGVPKSAIKRYPREAFNKYDVMRNILGDLENAGKHDVVQAIVSGFFRLPGPVDRDKLDHKNAVALLDEFRSLVGDDPIEAEIKKREQQSLRDSNKRKMGDRRAKVSRLEDLNATFMKLTVLDGVTPQQRGFQLEKLFFDLLRFEEMTFSLPYRGDGEQIDGHFSYEKFDYLVESKWTKDPSGQPDLSVFDGKIRGKAQSTRGLFLSASGFSGQAVKKFSGDAPRIVLMTGQDLLLVLTGRISFTDAMKEKIDAIVRHGIILRELSSVLT